MKMQIVQVINDKSPGITEYARQLDFQINSGGKYSSLIKKYNETISPDSKVLYHYSNATRAVLRPLLKSKSNENLVLIHDVMPRNRVLKLFFRSFLRIIDKKSRYIIVHTEAAKKLLIKNCIRINPEKVQVIPHGTRIVNTSKEIYQQLRLKYQIDRDKKVLFMLGRISSARGSKNFLSAFIKANKKNLILIVSGKCLDKEAEELMKNSENIRYLGFADNNLVEDCFRLCNVTVVYRDRWVGESSSTIVYSLGYALPVLVSDTPSFREILGDDGIFFQNHESAMINALELFDTDKDKMIQLQKNAKLLREQYKWETYLNKLMVLCGNNKTP